MVNLDKLTYAANLASLAPIDNSPRYRFVKGDICDGALVASLLREHDIDAIMHLAAESHVDRSIDGPAAFIETNIVGTYTLLDAARQYWTEARGKDPQGFRFHHISTDEVFGDLPFDETKFTEETPYRPSSPYSASKASADHLVRAWHATYGLPVVVSNCSNNYGPYHFPEKLIPLTILNALEGKPIAVYGKGENVRDWLHVEDHAEALVAILERGRTGKSYNVGGNAERTNLAVVETICDLLDARRPLADGRLAAQPDHLRHGPAGPRPPLRHRRRARSPANSAGGRSTASRRALPRPSTGISPTRPGGGPSARAAMRASASGRPDGAEAARHRPAGTGRHGACSACRRDSARVVTLGRPEMDLARPETIAAAIAAARPDVVVNAAAYTAVDRAESEKERRLRRQRRRRRSRGRGSGASSAFPSSRFRPTTSSTATSRRLMSRPMRRRRCRSTAHPSSPESRRSPPPIRAT